MSARGLFITGTDTGVGKTRVAVALLQRLSAMDRRAVGMKPVATGGGQTVGGLRNSDAMLLLQHSHSQPAYSLINPYVFAPPIAPHIAAAQAGVRIEMDRIIAAHRQLANTADWVIVEGAGGWRVPLNEREDMAAIARALELPVVLVVGLRLGCISHALLTAEAIARDGLKLAGWAANQIDPTYSTVEETVEYLAGRLSVPLLSRCGWQQSCVLSLDALTP
ncbi:MAG TPA: dethiobiotin synthase [Gammaproteobacteria bacterium]|nr:dethiobiotin synthase [Gammaproteobacteria bacterium]